MLDDPREPGEPEPGSDEEPSESETPRIEDAPAPAEAEPAVSIALPAAVTVTGRTPAATPSRPDLLDRQEPLYRDCRGFRLRLEPADLARLRELPGARGKSDAELGESFFDGQAERLVGSVAGDVPEGCDLRVVVDPYSRQAFVALEKEIRGILSF